MNKTLFLDRDGVVNHMVRYKSGWDSPQKPKDVILIDGILDIISWANQNNILVIEVSNQPGVAKGKMSQKVSDSVEAKVHGLLNREGVFIDKVFICPHHPEATISELKQICICRKPKPGLLLKASRELGIDLSKSIFLGDKASDAMAGKAAKVKTILYIHTDDEAEKVKEARSADSDYKAGSLQEALRIIKSHFK